MNRPCTRHPRRCSYSGRLGLPWFLGLASLVSCSSPPEVSQSDQLTDAKAHVVVLSPELVDQGQIESVAVVEKRLSQTVEVSGRLGLNEDRTARVGTPTEGRVEKLLMSLGDRVQKGAPLVAIHSHELIVARTDYDKAVAAVAAAKRELQFATDESNRAGRLLDAKAISLREHQAALTAVSAAKAKLTQSESEVSRTERLMHHLGILEIDAMSGHDDVWVRAPIGGTVLERKVTIGSVVNPSDDLALLSDLRTLWMVAEVPERQAIHIEAGDPVSIRVAAFDHRFSGTVFHVSETLNPSLQTVSVRALVDNPSGELRAEMYGDIRIDLGETEPSITVMTDAVQQINGEAAVFVEIAEGRFERRFVALGNEIDGWFPVHSGLELGERVVTNGSFLLKSEMLRSSFEEE